MSKLAWLFAATTLGLGVACAHLYRELQIERSRDDRVAAESRTPARMDVERADVPESDEGFEPSAEDRPFDPAPRATQGSPPPSSESRAQMRAQQSAERQAEMQARWADPEWRARALVRAESQVRQRNPDLGSVLRLNAEQETALVDLLARQWLQIQEANEPMRFASNSERQAAQQKVNALHAQHQQELAQHLGSGYAAYGQYQRQVPERWQVRELRSRLDESVALTPSQSTRLIDAMYQERDSYLQQIQSLEDFGGYSTQYPIVAISKDRDPAARARFAEQQIARTEEFMGRLRMQAQQILSAEQLRRFDEIQEEQLAREQSRVERMRNQAERRATRRAQ